MKPFKGKAIYQPAGRASEYAEWACNFYLGCSCGCDYCFNKKGRFAGMFGGNTPKLKSCFKDENHAIEVFEKELRANLPELKKSGLFFSFTTDPMLFECWDLTWEAVCVGKVLIPHCWNVVMSDDIRDCTCQDEFTFEQFEKRAYREKVRELEIRIRELEKEIYNNQRTIRKLLKKKKYE